MRIQLRHKTGHVTVDLQPEAGKYRVVVDDTERIVEAHYVDENTAILVIDGAHHRIDIARDGRDRLIAVGGEVYSFSSESGAAAQGVAKVAVPEIVAPMPGKVLQVLVRPGDTVEVGDGLVILEAMKMENRLLAEAAGTVAEVRVAEGDMVDGGQVLVVMSYEETASV